MRFTERERRGGGGLNTVAFQRGGGEGEVQNTVAFGRGGEGGRYKTQLRFRAREREGGRGGGGEVQNTVAFQRERERERGGGEGWGVGRGTKHSCVSYSPLALEHFPVQ